MLPGCYMLCEWMEKNKKCIVRAKSTKLIIKDISGKMCQGREIGTNLIISI